MLTKLRKGSTEILLQNDSARPHTSFKTWNKTQNLAEQCYPIPPTVLVCHPQDFHLFGALKDAVCGKNLRGDSHCEHSATGAGQGMVLTRHIYIFFFSVQGHGSGRRHCGKRVKLKLSVFIMCNFMFWD